MARLNQIRTLLSRTFCYNGQALLSWACLERPRSRGREAMDRPTPVGTLLRGCRRRLVGALGAARGLAGALGAFGDAGRLAAAVAQVIELGAADLAAAHHLDGVDQRRVDREYALHALAVGNLADREALVEPAARARDAHALVGLHAGALAFLDLDVDGHGVARLEIGDLLVEPGDLFLFEGLDDVHGQSSGRRVSRAPA